MLEVRRITVLFVKIMPYTDRFWYMFPHEEGIDIMYIISSMAANKNMAILSEFMMTTMKYLMNDDLNLAIYRFVDFMAIDTQYI
jgi:hypothetical protein